MRPEFKILAAVALSLVQVWGVAASDEVAARTVLGEAERLIELALPADALSVLDRLAADYPNTEAALFGELRRAQALMFLHRYDDAIEVAEKIVEGKQGTIVGCWAQCVIGQSLVEKGATLEGVVELQKVETMLPDDSDLGPMNEAREVLGRVCAEYVDAGHDDLAAVDLVGWDRTDHTACACVVSMIAVHRAREGDAPAAGRALGKLAILYPAQAPEIAWAEAEIRMLQGQDVLRARTADEEVAGAEAAVSAALATGPQEAARAYLMLARTQMRHGRVPGATESLEAARDRCMGTANAAEILYELGAAYYLVGRGEDAAEALRRVPAEWPRSGYVAPSLYLLGTRSRGNPSASLAALHDLAAGPYPRRWRALASWQLASRYRSTDPPAARAHYQDAAAILRECLAEDLADTSFAGDWRGALQDLIQAIQLECDSLPEEGEEGVG